MRTLVAIIVLVHGALALATEPPEDSHALGIEEGNRVTLERGDYIPRPLDDRTPLIVRLGEVSPVDDGFSYQFHFIGFEPGEYRLADYLMHPDGSPATELGERTFTVGTILPNDHDGSLTEFVPSTVPWFGGYRILLIALGIVWILGWIALAWFGRRKRTVEDEVTAAAEPDLAEQLRPYVEQAAAGELNSRGQAELERLLTAYWRDRLKLPQQRMASELAALRKHPEAGGLIQALERWLHHPDGASDDEIESLLAPYRTSGKEAIP
ncbi:hypothetical protein [Haloferula rosea]|uniref:Protein BatD n=1 Tax=Haloferula rosea TaxID=490093 RepID=A0A934R9J9_9BACT|nr:hypothetical protein [Haloferula rosea]MBK1825703.1 hypothetical protein [Haloferula rosea]